MENNNQYINIHNDDTLSIQEHKRSGILYYSINQVATLLGESDSKIRYYTNIFDNLLKIQVSNKELIYTDKDIDKLEFLIRLKDKGLTIKEIQSYCEELPLDESDVSKKGNALSIPDLIELISQSQAKEISKLRSDLFNHIDTVKMQLADEMKDYIRNEILESNKNLQNSTDTTFSKVENLINDKFESENIKMQETLCNLSNDNIENLINDKIESESIKMQEALCNLSNDIESKSIELNDQLVYRIKKFENVVEKAYTIEHEIASQNPPNFFARLFGAR
ncbi:MAG: MerR family transcriptional regulator [Clostridium butyricum]|nr:MerR family transcriptional regulator [Clostridium butyricum]